jgi:ABC-type glycerol-3-phosphate transport system substrate-binding protein
VEVKKWMTGTFSDNETFNGCVYRFYLKAGEHTLTLASQREAIAISSLSLHGIEKIMTSNELNTYNQQQGYQDTSRQYILKEAEDIYEKSNNTLLPTYDRSSPLTQPYAVSHIMRNTIGQTSWSSPGQWISYEVEVDTSGLYELGVKFKQSYQIGMATCRNIYIDGKIPSESYENVIFPYNVQWQYKTISDDSGTPNKIYLTKGKHIIKFEVTLGKWSGVLAAVDQINMDLNDLYRKIVMVTGTTPDMYRDYHLEKQIAGLTDTMTGMADRLSALADDFNQLNKTRASQSEDLRRVAKQLASFVQKPDTIAARLSSFRDNITFLSSWLIELSSQSLEMDYLVLKSSNVENPRVKASLWESLKHTAALFITSFTSDYSSLNENGSSNNSITVWISSGRDQAQIIKDLISDSFTPHTNISVNLAIVQSGLIEATLAGKGPDIALFVPRGQPINLAWRGSLTDLTQFDTYNEVASRFSTDAAIPYSFQNGVYALPDTQSFFMLFYRTDILKEMNLEPPKTWDEMVSLSSVLQQHNMNVGIPYSTVTAQGAVDSGLGVKDIFSTLLLQSSGSVYNADHTATGLDSDVAYSAFRRWTEFYTLYGYKTDYDFNTRFRSGEMPVGIASYEMYNTFSIAAPEIRNQWAMTQVPGIEEKDGTINKTVAASGSANILFKNAKNQNACWDFMDWFTTADVQYKYGVAIEDLLGASARYSSANLEAFDRLPWSNAELKTIQEQRSSVQEIPEVPGGYFVIRCLDNAFRTVVFNAKNPKEVFEQQNAIINEEIKRKLKEINQQSGKKTNW